MQKKQRHQILAVLVIILIAVGVTQAARPILLWNFDEGSGSTIIDSSGQGRNGNNEGATWQANGIHNSAYALSCSGGSMVTEPGNGDFLDGLEQATFAIWVKSNAINTDAGCLRMQNNADDHGSFRYDASGWQGGGRNLIKCSVYTTNGSAEIEGSSNTQTTEWQHLAMVWQDGEGLKLYIDGELDEPTAYLGVTSGTLGGFDFLRIGDGPKGAWNGLLDEFVIFDTAFSADEIKDLYNNGISGLELPGILAPTDKSLVYELSTTLTWVAGNTSVENKLYFSTDADAVDELAENVLVTTTGESSYTIENLVAGTTYAWRIVGVTADGTTVPGPVWTFTVPPYEAFNPEPADGGLLVPLHKVLTWDFGLNSIADTLYIGTDVNEVTNTTEGGIAIELPMGAVNGSYDPDGLENDTTYYWRVDEVLMDGTSAKGKVWHFSTVPTIAVTDPDLRGWWKFDTEDAYSALDSSGHNLHGDLITGDPQWVDGPVGKALDLNGSSFYTTSAPNVSTNSATMCGWIMPTGANPETGIIYGTTAGGATGLVLGSNIDDHVNRLEYRWDGIVYAPDIVLAMQEWAFVAMVIEPDKGTLYYNGIDVVRVNETPHYEVNFDSGLNLGAVAINRRFSGIVDDLRFYTKALTPAELMDVMQVGSPPIHEVDPNMIDDFESYKAFDGQTDPNVWDVWHDGYGGYGTRSAVGHFQEPYMERIIANSGGQSLPFYYYNDANDFTDFEGNPIPGTHAEISRSFDPVQDLTRYGALALVFDYHGDADNTVGSGDVMYVILEDSTGQSAVVTVAQPENLVTLKWQQARVELANVSSIDITALSKLTLGIGDRTNTQVGGLGIVYIDNIRLVSE